VESDFRNLVVWQLAIDLADRIYDAVKSLPDDERFVLNEQMRRAAVSVHANIAEGKGRWSIREYRQFVRHARGSLTELQSQILFAGRRGYLSAKTVDDLMERAEKLAEKISALINYLNRRTRKAPRPTTNDLRPSS
jgi:four helix bundle protein